MGWSVGLVFIYLFIGYFHPIDLYKMIMDMSRDYNKSNNT